MIQALRGKPLTVFGDGEQTRSFQFVDDLVRGLVKLMDNPNHKGPFNIGNPNEFTMIELANRVKEVVNPEAEIVFEQNTADDPHKRRPDITEAKKLLDWEPTVQLSEGLKQMIDDLCAPFLHGHNARSTILPISHIDHNCHIPLQHRETQCAETAESNRTISQLNLRLSHMDNNCQISLRSNDSVLLILIREQVVCGKIFILVTDEVRFKRTLPIEPELHQAVDCLIFLLCDLDLRRLQLGCWIFFTLAFSALVSITCAGHAARLP